MSAESVLKDLGIKKSGSYNDAGDFIVDLPDDIDFSRIYNILDKNPQVELQDNEGQMNVDNVAIDFQYKDSYLISLIGDLENDSYQLILTEI